MIGLGIGVHGSRWGAPTLDLDFTTGVLPPGLTFTRAGGGGRINSSGLYEWVGADVPRFDYDPITRACKGLLLEESRTRTTQAPNEFTNAAWAKQRVSVTPAAAVGSDGIVSMTKMVENAENNSHYIVQSQNYTAGRYSTATVEAKAGERSVLQIVLPSVAFGTNFAGFFNLNTGECFARSGSSAKMENLGNGIYRCHLTAQASATATDSVQIRMHTDYIDTLGGYQGDGVSGLYISNAQREVGTFATSFIKEPGGISSRAVDVLTMTGTNFSRWFNPTEGTIVVEFSVFDNGINFGGSNAFICVFDIDSAASANSDYNLFLSAAYPGYRGHVNVAGVSQVIFNGVLPLGTGARTRYAIAYKANDFAASYNGAAVLVDNSGLLPPSPDRLAIGSTNGGAGSHLNGHLRRFLYYPRRLSNARGQELAT